MTDTIDTTEAALMEFVGKAVSDVGAVLNGSMVVLGDRLGLYRAMAGGEPLTAAELAHRTGTVERYVREWLAAQAATGYVSYEGDGRYRLPPEPAIALTDESSPACVVGAFELAVASLAATDRITEAFRTGDGMPWGEHHRDVHEGCERFFRPGYANNLVSTWLPALDGVVDITQGGATVADLVCFFDCLHDMGDPVGVLAHVRSILAEDGTVLLVEPMAGDAVDDKLNPVGAAYYAFSTLLCTPNSLSQEVGAALGAQAGEARLRQVAAEAGFGRVRRMAETPFNLVLEVRP